MNKHYHLIGIGGIGMGTIASLLLDKGHRVSGSDLRENNMVHALMKKGAAVTIGHNADNVVDADVVVYSSAINEENCELSAAFRIGIPTLRRAQVLAQLMREHISITVAGAHGKTTTTSMISQMLTEAGLQPTTAIGGIVNGEHSHAKLGEGEHFVAEVDESDGSFLYFSPDYSIVTNIDLEHLDYYQNWKNIANAYQKFFQQTAKDGITIAFGDDKRLCSLLKETQIPFITFGFSNEDFVFATNISTQGYTTNFDCFVDGKNQGTVSLSVPGIHNIANALACICLGVKLSIDFNIIREALETYTGVQRRFQSLGLIDGIRVIDDYAHHPTEIFNTLQTAKDVNTGRVIAIFQPHRYSRFKALWKEFMDSMLNVDYLVVTDIYAASEDPIDCINSNKFVQELKKLTDKTVVYVKKEKVLSHLLKVVQTNDLVITLGAGDVNRIGYDLVKKLEARQLKSINKIMSKRFTEFGKVGVFMGGVSSERNISLKSGRAIYESLWTQGFDVAAIDFRSMEKEHIKRILKEKKISLGFIALHGKYGEDGMIQSICEELNIPFTGSGSKASHLAFNKISTQKLLKKNNVQIPNFISINPNEPYDLAGIVARLESFPLVVKPACEGSSIGVTIVQYIDQLGEAIESVKTFGTDILIEKFIQGRELTVGILEEKPLDVVEIKTSRSFFDFKAKYQSGDTDYMIPARIPLEIKHILQETALKVHTLMGCRDLSRVDFILDDSLKPHVLEINTIPGFTQTSLLPKAAGYSGLNFDQLCLKLTDLAYAKTKKEKILTADY